MELLLLADVSWRSYPATIMILFGCLVFWRALSGGLVHRGTAIVERVEGFRLAVLGLVLVGLGAAWMWHMPWLFFLALGIGFVEIRESTTIINAIKRGDQASGRGRAG
jgi:hypothetical protein